MSRSKFKEMWFSSRLSYLHKTWLMQKRFPLVMLETLTCIPSIKYPSTKSRDFHPWKRLRISQWCSLKHKTSLSSVNLFPLKYSRDNSERQWKKNLFDSCRWPFIFLNKFFKPELLEHFARLRSLRKSLRPPHSASVKLQKWSKILKGEYYP